MYNNEKIHSYNGNELKWEKKKRQNIIQLFQHFDWYGDERVRRTIYL